MARNPARSDGEHAPVVRLDLVNRRRPKIPYVGQTAATDCGAACLSMVLGYHGKHVPLDEVRELTGFGRDGAEAISLLNAGRWYGLRGRAYRAETLEDLALVPAGSILHWSFQHYVVFERVSRKGLHIIDPAGGRAVVAKEMADKAFTGIVLSFEPNDSFLPGGQPKETGIRRLLGKLRSQSGRLARTIAASLVLQLTGLALPLLTGAVVDRVVPRSDHHLLAVLGAGMAAFVLFQTFTSFLRAHLLLHLRTTLDASLTLAFIEHLFDLPFAFFQKRTVGDLAMRLNSNTQIRELLTGSALSALLDGSLVVVYLVLMFWVSWKLALLVLLLGILRIVLFVATRVRYRELMTESLVREADARAYEIQMLSGIETLKASGTEHRAIEHWSNLFVDVLNTSLARGRLNAIVDSLRSALQTASPIVVLLSGAALVLTGEMSLGTMLALSALATGFLGPLTSLITVGYQLQTMGSLLDRIDDVLETEPEQASSPRSRVDHLSGNITLRGVGYRFRKLGPDVVKDVSVEIPPGAFVAIAGRSGAGKSTLGHLLLGLYQPTEGEVLYDGTDINELDLRSLRRRVGIVSQQPFLFGTSVRANIALSEPDVHLARVIDAARRAKIHDEIMAMPMAYETPLSEGGSSLSGGQRQRIALARALVHKPSVLLLDEATSALDAMTEGEIQAELERLKCTRIVIAHRLSTIKNADLLLVMEGGELVESGPPEVLRKCGGMYARLIAEQLAGN